MKKYSLLIALGFAPLTLAADQNPMQPGLWEYTMKVEVPGMPFAMPPQTFKQCVTQQDVDKGAVAQDPSQKSCEVKNFKNAGSKTSYDIVCSGEQALKGHAEFMTAANTMTGLTTMDMGEGQTMKQNFSAKRVGDCKK